jgi:hypothetical protein
MAAAPYPNLLMMESPKVRVDEASPASGKEMKRRQKSRPSAYVARVVYPSKVHNL